MSEVWRSSWGGSAAPVRKVRQDDYDLAPKTPPHSRWLRRSELGEKFAECTFEGKDTRIEKGGYLVWCDGKQGYLDTSMGHMMVVAMTDSHKTRGELMSNLEVLSLSGESAIIHDPKGELYRHFYTRLVSRGIRVRLINYRDPVRSDCWNMLTLPYRLWKSDRSKAKSMLMDIAAILCPIEYSGDSFWSSSGQQTLLGFLYALMERAQTEEEANVSSLVSMILSVTKEDGSFMRFFDSFDENSDVAIQLTSAVNNADNTRRCILGMVYNSISKILTSDVLEEMMAVNNIDMESLGMEQTFLFLITPDEKDTYNQMVGRFVSQTYYALIDKAQSLGGSLPVRVNILLDEFASLGKIKDVPSMLAAGRSRNIRCMIIIQSLSQLESVYGREAESIRNNCSIWTYLGGRDCSFMDTLCRLCGNSENGKPLLTPTQLMHLEKGREAFVMVGREYPMIGRIADISEYDIEPFEFAEPALRWDRTKPKLIGKERLFKVPRQAEPDAVFRIRGDTVMIGPGMGARDEIAVAALFDSIYGTDVDVDEMDPLMDIGDALKTPVDAEWFLRSFMGLEDRDLKSFVNSLDLKDGVSKVKVRNGLRRIRSIV